MLPCVLNVKVAALGLHPLISLRWPSRGDKVLRAAADEVSQAQPLLRLVRQQPVVRIVLAQKSPVEPSLTQFFTVFSDWLSCFTRCGEFILV